MVAPVTPTSGSWKGTACSEVIDGIISRVTEIYNIDTTKIILTGFSLGGIGTWYHVAKNPDKFCAAIPISAMPDASSKAGYASSSVPMYVIHSTSDELFPYEDVKSLVEELKGLGSDITLNTVENVSHYETVLFSGALKQSIPWLEERWNN